MAKTPAYPARLSDPTYRARRYVAHRLGFPDPVVEQRKARADRRGAVAQSGSALQVLPIADANLISSSLGLELGYIYRLNGSPTRLAVRTIDAGGNSVVGTVPVATGAPSISGTDTDRIDQIVALLQALGLAT